MLIISSFSFTLKYGLVALFGAIFIRVVLRWRKRPHAPGPFLARFTNIWQATEMIKGHFHTTNIELHQTHGIFSFL